MTLTIGWWIIPLLLTLGCTFMAFRPVKRAGFFFALDALFQLLWLIPASSVWPLYFCVVWLVNKF